MKYYAIRLGAALCTFILGLGIATALRPFTHAADVRAEQDILRVEDEYIQAHLNRDVETLDRVLSDEFTIRSRYRLTSKAQRLALLQDPRFAFEYIKTYNVRVDVDGDSATVTGEALLRESADGEELTLPPYRFMRTYERQDGAWKIVCVRVMP